MRSEQTWESGLGEYGNEAIRGEQKIFLNFSCILPVIADPYNSPLPILVLL